MNDFTKEELEIIYQAVCAKATNLAEGAPTVYAAIENLVVKVRGMVEGYCEHHYVSMGNAPWLHCIKCKDDFSFKELI